MVSFCLLICRMTTDRQPAILTPPQASHGASTSNKFCEFNHARRAAIREELPRITCNAILRYSEKLRRGGIPHPARVLGQQTIIVITLKTLPAGARLPACGFARLLIRRRPSALPPRAW